METKEIIRNVKKIEISTKTLVDSLITGNYNSVFKGQGIDFSEIREYKEGDDIRAIDWKVTARFNKPFIKEFIEDRDLRIYFAIDISGSGSFGDIISKKRRQIEIAASLMFAAQKNNDNIGVFLFSDDIEIFIPARKGKKHLLSVLSKIISYEPESLKTNINDSLIKISKIIKKRSVIFIISDFYGENFRKPLKKLKERHDIVAIKVNENKELSIPDVGLIELEDEETGEQILVDTSDEEFRKNYMNIIRTHEKKLEDSFKKTKVDCIELHDDNYASNLRKFFKKRKMRQR